MIDNEFKCTECDCMVSHTLTIKNKETGKIEIICIDHVPENRDIQSLLEIYKYIAYIWKKKYEILKRGW